MRIKQNTSFDFPKCLSTNGFTFFVKLFNHLISLHKPPSCFTLPTFLLVSFVILVIVVKSPKTSSFFWISWCRKVFFDKNQIPAPFYNKRLDHLIVLNLNQSLTHQTPAKCTNLVTLSNYHMNYLFRVYGNLVHYSIYLLQVFIFRCIYLVVQK